MRHIIEKGYEEKTAIRIARNLYTVLKIISSEVGDHPNLQKIYNMWEHSQLDGSYELFIFYRYVEGITLMRLGDQDDFDFSSFPIDLQLRIIGETISALDIVLGLGYYYNFSPENILIQINLDEVGNDFGWVVRPVLTGFQNIVPTVHGNTILNPYKKQRDRNSYYNPNELYYADTLDERTLVYSLALTFLDIMTRKARNEMGIILLVATNIRIPDDVIDPDYTGFKRDICIVNPHTYSLIGERYNLGVEDVFRKATAFSREDRYDTLDTFLKNLALAMLHTQN